MVGWRLRVDVTLYYASVIIRDYAYNSNPDQPILAGQTTATGIIENSFASSINLFPNPATNHLTITLPNANKKVEITITDITKKIIYSTTVSETQKIEVNTQDFADGIYVVKIQTADFIATKKLVFKN
ncbi:MAG: T9SS type A sorting domain-containing protein [Bacteroidetes bacterium]|nr:T9SS type A sorting domain-containing protein [Bacteroidota bacterium]